MNMNDKNYASLEIKIRDAITKVKFTRLLIGQIRKSANPKTRRSNI